MFEIKNVPLFYRSIIIKINLDYLKNAKINCISNNFKGTNKI